MKLRYLNLPRLAPLQDLTVTFGNETILGRKCAIRFFTGVNGSGKSRMMQALAEVFLSLESERFPPFALTLAYDLGHGKNARTVYLKHSDHDPSSSILAELEQLPADFGDWDWEGGRLPNYVRQDRIFKGEDELPGSGSIGAFLPKALLAYTSGASAPWDVIFAPRYPGPDEGLEDAFGVPDSEYERPLNWSYAREREHVQLDGGDAPLSKDDTGIDEASDRGLLRTYSGIGLYVPPEALDLAFCAVMLGQVVDDLRRVQERGEGSFIEEIEDSDRPMSGLRGILNRVGVLWPLFMSLDLSAHPGSQQLLAYDEMLERLLAVSTDVVYEPSPGTGCRLLFDLHRPLVGRDARDISTAAALIEAISGKEVTETGQDSTRQATSLDVFAPLRQLQAEGLLNGVTVALRKRVLADVLLYDWLSDGEKVLLGRTALFQLLAGNDDALFLLDEPETHFNDIWKREIVDIVDDSLRDDASEVVMSTHSSITLTDAFDTEITLLRKDEVDDIIYVVPTPIESFGASPTEIMRGIFRAPETVGQRATEFLDLILLLATFPEKVQLVWNQNDDEDDESAIRDSTEFLDLKRSLRVRDLRRYHGNESTFEDQLIRVLLSVRSYTRKVFGKRTVDVADALDALERRLGPGYYHFEVRRRLRALRERPNGAPPS